MWRSSSLLLASCGALACGAELEFPPPPTAPPAPPATVAAPKAEGSAMFTPLFSLQVSDPFAVPLYLEAVRRPAVPLAAVEAGSLTAQAVLDTKKVEARVAPDPIALSQATLAEGERVRLDLDTQGDECFAAIAHGGLGVMELDVFISSGDALAPTILARDEKSGPEAVAGGSSSCATPRPGCGPVCVPARAVPAGLRVEVVVRKGKGPVVLGLARHAG